MLPKLHLLVLLGKQVDVILVGKIKSDGNFFRCMKLEEIIAGKYYETSGTCSELAGTCFTFRGIPRRFPNQAEGHPHKKSTAVGLLAPSQRYSTIEGEEACRL